VFCDPFGYVVKVLYDGPAEISFILYNQCFAKYVWFLFLLGLMIILGGLFCWLPRFTTLQISQARVTKSWSKIFVIDLARQI
jgi:hypothetical protein